MTTKFFSDGSRLAVAKLVSVEGINTRSEYLANRRLAAVGIIEGFPAGYQGTLWKLRHEDSGQLAVYFASELVSVENLEAALAQGAEDGGSGAPPHAENKITSATPAGDEVSKSNSDVPSVDSASDPTDASPGCHAVAFTGDISEAHCDVLLASFARTSNHKQFAITDALKSIAGSHFHDRADQVGPVENLSAILVRKSADADLPFGDVLLVAHDGSTSVQAFIFTALQHADNLGYSTAAIPLLNFVTETKPDAETVSTLLLQVQEAYLAFKEDGAKSLSLVVVICPQTNLNPLHTQ